MKTPVWCWRLRRKSKKGARWATPQELAKAGYLSKTKEPNRLLVTGDGQNYLTLPEGETN